MLHSRTPKPVKDTILESFTKSDSHVRVLFATTAFRMGGNAKGVKTIIHVGLSKNLEAYAQERAAGVENKARQLFCLTTKTMLFQRSVGETYFENVLMLVVTPPHHTSCLKILVIIVPKNVIVIRQVVSQLSSYLLAQHT